jgi:hypothetical protein
MEALIKDRDRSCSAMARLESELVVEREAKHAAEVRVEAIRQKGT